MKKLLSVLSSTLYGGVRGGLLFLALLTASSLWAYDFQLGDLYYNITSSSEPYTVEVTQQQSPSYGNYTGLTSAIIPESVTYNDITYSVTSIGSSAFKGCTSLTSVTIPESITFIDWPPFTDCSSLTSVVWNAKKCADYTDYCPFHGIGSQITSFTLGENVEYIPAGLCNNMSKLTAITIPNSVTSIGQSAFSYCSSLTSITIPNNVVSIGNRAFDNCSLLSSVVWNAKNAADNNQPFYSIDSQITSFTFGENVEHIPAELCKDMNQLTSITIPNSVISIGESAFYNCSALASVIIPNSVMSIGKSAFYNTEIYNDESNWENSVLYINNCLIKSQNDSQSSYTIKDGTRTIGDNAFHGHSILTSVTIPNGVVSIGNRAFYNCFGLTSITIPNSVTRIGDEAFYGCSKLNTPIYNESCFIYMPISYSGAYSIPKGIKQIAHSAFKNCSSLTSITIPNSVTNIGEYAFHNCSALVSTNIPNGVTYIGDYLFAGCSSLSSIAIPEIVTSIGDGAFSGCSSLSSVTIGDNVTSIGDEAFCRCSSLSSVTIGDSVTSIGERAFQNCSALTSITIPKNVKFIGGYAFSGCEKLSTIIWNVTGIENQREQNTGSGLPSLGDGMFVPNTTSTNPFSGMGPYITSITFGEDVQHIPSGLFESLENLKSVILPDSLKTIGSRAFSRTGLTSITIPASVYRIGSEAFATGSLTSVVWNAKNCESVSNLFGVSAVTSASNNNIIDVVFGDSVEHIPAYLFMRSKHIKEVTIPNSVHTIGEGAFSNCDSLTSVTLGNSVTTIDRIAFVDCSSLKEIVIPNSVTRIGDEAFYGCSSLMSVTIGDKLTNIATSLFWECTSLASLTIGNSVTSIGDYAFYKCSSLTSVTIPNSVTSIGDKAFFGCSRLNNVVLGNSVMTIGERAFCNCSIRSLTIPNSVTSIGDGAFGNNSFTSITVPSSVTSVGYSIFGGCNRLSSIVWNANTGDSYYDYDGTPISPIGTLNALKSIVFGDSVEYIPAEMCHNSNSIESVTIGKNVKRIGKLAFNNCTGLTQVNYTGDVLGWCQMNFTYINDNPNYYAKNLYINGEKVIDLVIPKSVKTINPYTFYGCSELSSLVIPKSVTSIGADAFGECRKLYDIYCYPTTPPTAEESSFANYNVNLYVPCESLKDYQMDMVFGSFKYIQCLEDLIPSEPQDTTITHTAEMVTICEGEAYKWHGYEYSQSGTYTYTETEETEEYIYHNVYTLELTVLPSETIEYVIEAEDSYEWHGVVYTESGTYTYRYECTTEILYLTIKDTPDTPDNPIIDTVITGLQYADAYFIADAEYGDYWVFDLYQDYDAYDYVYPAVYVMVNEAYSKNSLNGTYNVLYTEYYTDAESMISTDDEAEDFVGTLTIKHVKGTNYSFNGSFVVDGITYTYDQIVSVFAYEYSAEEGTYYELTLSEIDSPDTPDTPERVLSCEEAVALCLETGTTATTEEYTIRGYVTEITTEYSERYNDISFYMADTKDGGQVLFTYRIKPMFETDCAVKVGDFVEAVGPLVNYNGNSPEVYPGVYTIVNEPEIPTGTSDIQLPTSNTKKLVKDGQLLIIREGKTYNAQGAIIN